MTDEERKLSPAEWMRLKGYKPEDRNMAMELYQVELKEYSYRIKHESINNALEAIKAAGFKGWLQNFTNAHVQAKTKRGKILSYYATTGTITGYQGTEVEGIDKFIELLEAI